MNDDRRYAVQHCIDAFPFHMFAAILINLDTELLTERPEIFFCKRPFVPSSSEFSKSVCEADHFGGFRFLLDFFDACILFRCARVSSKSGSKCSASLASDLPLL